MVQHRYGFNGKENDNEVKGEGNQQDYGFRIYDNRLGRFLSIDPLTDVYPDLTPYQYASNTPIAAKDIDGAEADVKFDGFERNDRRAAHILYPGNERKQQEYIRSNQKARGYGAITGLATVLSAIAAPEIGALVLGPLARLAPLATGATLFAGRYGPDAIGFAAAALGYDGDIPGANGDEIARGLRIGAGKFYGKFAGYAGNVGRIADHLRGIDFTKDVTEKVLKEGTVVEQWVGKNGVGDYFTEVGADASKLGISLKDRVKKTFTLTQDVKVLQSTTADIAGHKGGEIQYFSPEIKAAVEEVKN